MKKLSIIISAIVTFILTITITQTLQSCNAQKPDPGSLRYFEAMYVGIDENGQLQHGTYFFIMKDNYPEVEYVNRLIVEDYKLSFDVNNTEKLSVILTEFKNQNEWMHFKRR